MKNFEISLFLHSPPSICAMDGKATSPRIPAKEYEVEEGSDLTEALKRMTRCEEQIEDNGN